MLRRTHAAAAGSLLAASLLLAPLSALADEDTEDPTETGSPSELPVLDETEGHDGDKEGTTFSIHSLERTSSGETTLLWSVTSHEDAEINTTAFSVPQYWEYFQVGSTFGVTLLDESNQIRYYPLVDSERACLCAGGIATQEFDTIVNPGDTNPYWTTYLLPADLTNVTVEVPDYDPVENIDITDIS